MIKGRGVTHAVRNEQKEYKSRRKKSVLVVETMCGRHVEGEQSGGKVTCRTCVRAMRARR